MICCAICGRPRPQIHHIVTRGAGGSDDPENLIPLCYVHHTKCHAMGRDTFARRYRLEDRFGEAVEHERDRRNQIRGVTTADTVGS